MDEKVHISSLIVQVQPRCIDALKAECLAHEQVEVPAVDPAGKCVVLIEAPSQRHIVEFIDWLQEREGVLSVAMVYHHVESIAELEREVAEYEAHTA